MAMEAGCPEANCGFVVRSNDESEVREMLETHAGNVHDMKLSSSDIRDLIKTT